MSAKAVKVFLGILTLLVPTDCRANQANRVKVFAGGRGYELLLNGKPFYIQGAGVGMAFGQHGENYLKMAKELGANAVRTWGTDQGTKKYLDEARRQGLYVDAGVWLNFVDKKKTVSYIGDTAYMAKKEKETLDYVKILKNHPAVLMWNLGNEVIRFTPSEEERAAFCRFLEQLVQKVHALDPDHPVIYAASGAGELPYLAKYVPSLDIIGVNDYGSPIMVQGRWKDLGFRVPYVLTEFGPLGPWDMKKDANGRFIEQGDYTKAAQYRNYWKLVRERRGNNLGGFVFHLGETTQETLTCFNLNYHEYKKESFIVMQQLYKNMESANHAPRIKFFTGVPRTIHAKMPFSVKLDAADPEGEALKYDYIASTAIEGVLAYRVNSEIPVRVEASGETAVMVAPSEPGLYRIYGIAKDASGNFASLNHTLKVE